MKETICSFCGQEEIRGDYMQEKIEHIILDLIKNRGVTAFYSGHTGQLDSMCEKSVRNAKLIYPHIKLIWITSGFTKEEREGDERGGELFDEILMTDNSDIQKSRRVNARNLYIIERSDFMICHVTDEKSDKNIIMKYGQMMGVNIIRVV